MLFRDLVETSERVRATRGRRGKVRHLATLLGRAAPDEIEIGVAFLSGRLRQGRIGLGGAAVRDAHPTDAAAAPTLSLCDVDARLERIADARGPGSTRAKRALLRDLFGHLTAGEQRFLTRLVLGELRQGALEPLVLEGLAQATDLPIATIRRAVMTSGDAGQVAQAALLEGAAGLTRFRIELFRPVQPMLAQSATDVGDAIERLPDAILEYKLDGARIQIHKSGDEVKIYSRELRDVTAALPDVVDAVRAVSARDCILDGETIVLRPDGTPEPFQVTMRRFGRKLDVDRLKERLPLTPYVFDILFLNGQDLTNESLSVRHQALAEIGAADLVVPRVTIPDATRAAAFLNEALRRGHEGIMAKASEAAYEAGSRGSNWLKVKPVHSLDLVVLAAEWGHGRRRGYLSNLHLGARDAETDGFVMLGKTFKGMTDALLAWQTTKLLALEVSRDAWTVYVRPELVVEVAFDSVQASSQYPGGFALRFARVKRYRTDKAAREADTVTTVRALFDRALRPT